MSFINYPAGEINCKIVYYGPGLGGKTANVQHIFDRTAEGSKGRHYRASRRLILRGVDGIVFVADSQPGRLDADAESMSDLAENLAEQGQPLEDIPLVIQYNKRDLDDAVPIAELRELLNPRAVPDLEASAAKGLGVFEMLRVVGRLVLTGLKLPRR